MSGLKVVEPKVMVLPAPAQPLQALTHLDLSDCSELQSVPEWVGTLPVLRFLFLSRCSAATTLPGQLPATLVMLDASEMAALTALPEHTLPAQLQSLSLACSSLSVLPASMGSLVALQFLSLSGCNHLVGLPAALGNCRALRHLDLSGCQRLTALPESLGQCTALEYLSVQDCKLLTALPNAIGQLTALRTLKAWCSRLQGMPASVGQCTSLTLLDICAKELTALPASLGNLSGLTCLLLAGCSKQLRELPERLFVGATALTQLDLSHCQQLTSLPSSLGCLGALHTLTLDQCESLQGLPSTTGQLRSLRTLSLKTCSALTSLPEGAFSAEMVALEVLDLSECRSLTSLPESATVLPRLRELNLMWCVALTALPETIGRLRTLEDLQLALASGLTRLPDSLGQLHSLRSLDIRRLHQVTQLPSTIGKLHSLTSLVLSSCSALTALPESSGQLPLERLAMADLPALTHLPRSLARVTTLWGCFGLQGEHKRVMDALLRANTGLRLHRVRQLVLVLTGRRFMRYSLPPELWALVDTALIDADPTRHSYLAS